MRATTRATIRDVVAAALALGSEKNARFLRLGATADIATASGMPAGEAQPFVSEAVLHPQSRAPGSGNAATFADVLLWEGATLALHAEALPAGGTAIELHALALPEGGKESVPRDVMAALLEKHGGFEDASTNYAWLDRASEDRVSARLQAANVPAAFREDVAQVLQAESVRRSLATLRKGHVLADAPERDLDILAFADLARKQFVLSCSKAPDDPLLTFDEEDDLNLILKAKARCPRCNEAFERRHVRLLYTLSDAGADATTHAIRILHPLLAALRSEGAPVMPFPVTRGGHILGGLAYCAGLTVAVHAFDRDVVPNDALTVSDACLEVQPDVVVVATTSEVTEDAKARFAEAVTTGVGSGSVRVHYFERFDPARVDAVRAWWQRLGEDRVSALLEARPLAFARTLGLPAGTLARAAIRARSPEASRSISPTAAGDGAKREREENAPAEASVKGKGGRS